MFTVKNNVTDEIVFNGSEREFISVVYKIAIENEDYDFSVLTTDDAIEYLEDYCDNLELVED